MTRNLVVAAALLLTATLQAQVAMSRYLTIKDGKMTKFKELAALKTKKYNSKKGQPAYYTFEVLSGPNAQKLWRVQVADQIDDFDTVDTAGNAYWQQTVGKMHSSQNVQYWSFNENASHRPDTLESNMLSRMLFYTISNTGAPDFWRFRTRVARAMKESNSNLSMNVWSCGSGCNGNVVLVSFGHKNFADQRIDNEKDFPLLVEQYDKMFGKDAYEADLKGLNESLENLWGRRAIHMRLLPELSSPPNME